MADRLFITSRAVYQAEHTLERTIRDVIKVFKVFSPFYSYKSKYLSGKDMVKISPAVFNYILREEGADAIDDYFYRNTMIRFGKQEAERN